MKIQNTPPPSAEAIHLNGIDLNRIRKVIENSKNGYMQPAAVQEFLDAAGIPRVKELLSSDSKVLMDEAKNVGFPLVMKVVGPVHKTDVGGVVLNIQNEEELMLEFEKMQKIEGYQAVMLQPMLKGLELFIGATYERDYGHVVMCGLGGIYVEALKDIRTGLAPLSNTEACAMIRSLQSYKLLQGIRGEKGVDIQKFADVIVRLSTVLRYATEIKELDLNPLMATEEDVVVVDARVRVEA